MLLHEKLKNHRLILASGSPRRRQLIADCGLDYVTADGYDVEEVYPDDLEAQEVPIFLARLKAESYPHALAEKDILITADTVVVLADKVLGKPADRAEAIAMLGALSGACHSVITGVMLRSHSGFHSFSARTQVWFRVLSTEEIEYYVDTYRPYDKAGAYGVQEWIGYVAVERIEGSFYNVMGLPIQMLYTNLNNFISQ